MNAAVDRFVKFLVMECEDANNGAGDQSFALDLLVAAKAEILAGNGSIGFLQSSAANGKSVAQSEGLTCVEVAFACRQALRLFNDDAGASPFTFISFRDLNR